MTVSAGPTRVVYPGTGSPGPFPVRRAGQAIVWSDPDHIHVAHMDENGIVTPFVRDNQYTLSGGPTTGEVLLKADLEEGELIAIWREQPLDQNADFSLVGDFSSTTHNEVNDQHRHIDQELNDKIDRSLKLSRFAANDATVEISPVANTLLGFNAAGQLTTIDPDEVPELQDGAGLGVTPVNKGGTGSTTEAGARRTLGINFVVVNATTLEPPEPVVDGEHYLVPMTATGEWVAQRGKIAFAADDAFSYLTPQTGWTVFSRATDILYYFDGAAWVASAGSGSGGGGSGGNVDFSDLDGRVIGIGQVNGHGGQEFTVRHTADGRILITGDQAALGYDAAGDNWFPFELEWDRSLNIEKVYVGTDYLLIQTDQEVGNLWSVGNNATYGALGHGDTVSKSVPTRIAWLVDNAVHVESVVTEANTGHAERFWFAVTSDDKVIGCGAGTNYTQGNGATGHVTTPAYVKDSGASDITDVVEVSCWSAYGPVWARTSAGTAYRWGAGTSGALANAGTTDIQYPEVLGGGTPQTGISKIVTTSSGHDASRAVTAAIIGNLLQVCGDQTYGIGTGVVVGNQTIFALVVGDLSDIDVADIAIGGGEYAVLAAIDTDGNFWIAGRNAQGVAADGTTTDVSTFVKPAMPTDVQGTVEKVRIGGADDYGTVFVQAAPNDELYIYSIGYDGAYQTGKNETGTTETARTYGKVLGQLFDLVDWQIVGDEQNYGLHVRCENGTDRYCGYNAQGQGGTQPGNLHAVPYLQGVKGIGSRLLKQISWIEEGWTTAQDFEARDALMHNGTAYISINTHTSGPSTEPGIGASWSTVWAVMAEKGDPGPAYAATSTTSLSVGTGTKVIQTQEFLAYSIGARLRVSYNQDAANTWMEGICAGYSEITGVLTVNIDTRSGTGTYAQWNINIAGQRGSVTDEMLTIRDDAIAARDAAQLAQGGAETAEDGANNAEDGAVAAYQAIQERLLAPKSADPSVDDLGEPLQEGALYFNTSLNRWRVYDGADWTDMADAAFSLGYFEFTASQGQTVFTGADDWGGILAYTPNLFLITLNGSALRAEDFTATDGVTITLTEGANEGEELNVYTWASFNVANTYTQAQVDGFLAAKADASTVAGFLAANQNLDELTNKPLAFNTIKQAATDSATGVVEKATSEEIAAATADKYPDAAGILSAMAWQDIDPGATPAIDHADGVNRKITHTDNATMGAPSSPKPGWPLNFWIIPGAYTTAWHANYKFGADGAPDISAEGVACFLCLDASNFQFLGFKEKS